MLDTNILVSALISRDGAPGRVLAAIKRAGLTLVTSEAQLDKLRSVVRRDRLRSGFRPEEAEDLIDNIEAVGEVIRHLPDLNASPDPDDNPILATAIAGRADLIVSGYKKHMLALGSIDGIPIVTAAVAADRLRRQQH